MCGFSYIYDPGGSVHKRVFVMLAHLPHVGYSLIATAVLIGSVVTPSQSMAQQSIMIRLESDDGTVSLEGRLMWIQDGFYVIETAGLNTMMVDASLINCVSAICPN